MDMQLTETQRMIRHTIREYLNREIEPLVPEMESGRLLPYGPIRQMVKELGLGAGGDLTKAIKDSAPEEMLKFYVPRILSIEMSRVCAGFSLSHGASVGLCAGNILAKGTPEQKHQFAGPLLRFEKFGCWALTEPQAGSSALRDMKTTAVREGDHYILNGSKTFISNAPYADTFLVFAKLRENGSERAEAFICERGDPGLETGKPLHKMGFRSSPTGEIFLSECRIPANRRLGSGAAARGDVKERLSRERIGLTAISYGIMERAFDIGLSYARERHQGGRAIGEYQLIQRRLARMYTALSNSRSIVFADIWAGKRLNPTVADASVGKLYIAEAATFVCQEAVHILAGYGYMEEYIVERLFRDAKLIELGGGTTEIQELTTGRWIFENYEI